MKHDEAGNFMTISIITCFFVRYYLVLTSWLSVVSLMRAALSFLSAMAEFHLLTLSGIYALSSDRVFITTLFIRI